MQDKSTSVELSYADKVLSMIWANLGPVKDLYDTASIDEIQINAPHEIYIRERGVDTLTSISLDPDRLDAACTAIASYNDKTIARKVTTSQAERQRYILSAKLPGVRLEVAMPPVAVRGISLCIRKHNPKIITLEEYIEQGVITKGQAKLLTEIAARSETFIVSGPTYSGKTTLVNTIINSIPQDKRLFLIEQISELKIAEGRNHVRIECDPEHGITAETALKAAMRFSPSWIINGELRGQEAINFLEAANTGHAGGTTIHANSARDALERLEDLCLQAQRSITEHGLKSRIARSINWVIHIELTEYGRRITGLIKITGRTESTNSYTYEDMTAYEA
ncbi:Flp pilus assembly complex ATPase component TadA (plasmid) [Comamonas aquatica]|nr:Flp pilus assembly complex ATPase component TadA [Comamonas aquatica]